MKNHNFFFKPIFDIVTQRLTVITVDIFIFYEMFKVAFSIHDKTNNILTFLITYLYEIMFVFFSY